MDHYQVGVEWYKDIERYHMVDEEYQNCVEYLMMIVPGVSFVAVFR